MGKDFIQLMTAQDFADHFNVGPGTVRQWRLRLEKRGIYIGHKMGRDVMYIASDIKKVAKNIKGKERYA